MTHAETVRVVVVDDSALFREAISEILLDADAGLQVVARVGTGAEALRAVEVHRPDLVTLDLGLPDIDGFEVVHQLMARLPTPILVLTASLSPPGRKEALFSLSLGALDVMQKPTAEQIKDAAWCRRFRDRARLIARSPVVPHLDFKVQQWRERGTLREQPAPLAARIEGVQIAVLVGSAGSLRAVNTILAGIQGSLPLAVPVVIAMHLHGFMGVSLARFLADDFHIKTRVMEEGDRLLPEVVCVAPGGQHVQIEGRAVRLLAELPDSKYRPDLNVLLESVARSYGKAALAVILSGMGDDGAKGMLAVRRAGGTTLAQAYDSCLVASMPRKACELGAVDAPVSLQTIGTVLARLRLSVSHVV